jgi:hypothetical protein
MQTRTPHISNSMKHSSRDCRPVARLLIPLVLGCFALLSRAQATDLDSVLPNGNTADGSGVLVSLTSGVWNSGFGFEALNHDTGGKDNTATGLRALFSDTTGSNNTANGVYALYSNINGWYNNAVGAFALANNTSGNYNTANGYAALYRNTADYNTANGYAALYHNTTGFSNTATGSGALSSNTTAGNNTANGVNALFSNTTGTFNTAIGGAALVSNTTGGANTATGVLALSSNTTGATNTAIGFVALQNNTGDNNTATGAGALNSNTTGAENTANGTQALVSNDVGNNNTAIGRQTLHDNTSGSDNIALGADAGFSLTTGDHNIDIGDSGVAGESGTIRIGNNIHTSQAFIAGISGVTVPGGVAVIIDANGHLGTTVSSARFKNEIKPMDKASEAILALKPVTFCYKKELDPNGIPQFGLVAEEVEKVNPDLVVRDKEGKPYSVRYDAVNAMLLNEFLKEHRTVQEQKAIVAQLKQDFQSRLAEQQNQIEALTASLQKVSAQLEASKPAPHVVNNP